MKPQRYDSAGWIAFGAALGLALGLGVAWMAWPTLGRRALATPTPATPAPAAAVGYAAAVPWVAAPEAAVPRPTAARGLPYTPPRRRPPATAPTSATAPAAPSATNAVKPVRLSEPVAVAVAIGPRLLVAPLAPLDRARQIAVQLPDDRLVHATVVARHRGIALLSVEHDLPHIALAAAATLGPVECTAYVRRRASAVFGRANEMVIEPRQVRANMDRSGDNWSLQHSLTPIYPGVPAVRDGRLHALGIADEVVTADVIRKAPDIALPEAAPTARSTLEALCLLRIGVE